MKPDGCFFDLDGTLCDTAPDIFGCWLAALKAAGLETERFRRDFRIGPPLEPMIARPVSGTDGAGAGRR